MREIDQWLKSIDPKVAGQVKVAGFDEIGPALHIDLNPVKEFWPMFSRRMHPVEDNTVPRVCVGTSLIGCISGYASVLHNFYRVRPGEKMVYGGLYRGGCYIHEIDYEWILLPNGKLSGDGDISGEKWLVSYKPQFQTYPAKVIGKFFVYQVTEQILDKTKMATTWCIYLQADKELRLNVDQRVDKGYYRLSLITIRDKGFDIVDEKKSKLGVEPIDKQEWEIAKSSGLELLSKRIVW